MAHARFYKGRLKSLRMHTQRLKRFSAVEGSNVTHSPLGCGINKGAVYNQSPKDKPGHRAGWAESLNPTCEDGAFAPIALAFDNAFNPSPLRR